MPNKEYYIMRQLLKKIWFPYIFPFVLFLLLTELARLLPDWYHVLYMSKIMIVGALLWFWRREYAVDISLQLSSHECLVAVFSGLLVLIIWIVPEGYLLPFALGWSPLPTKGLIAVRLLGAAIVVPFMEELFWRSFLLRYLINPDFRTVPLGSFTWFSFISVSILFGLEHHRIIVGIIAGVIYNLLLIRQKKLSGCILAHCVTNLGLGIYVLITESWVFW
jgi:CAAX prenyl protease-like protein